MITLESNRLRIQIDPAAGGRMASLRADGHELLVAGDRLADPMAWGSFPMVPWAGRVRHGRFRFDGVEHQLPIGLAPHAIHGTGYLLPWIVTAQTSTELRLRVDLGPDWPFPAEATQRFQVDGDTVVMELSVRAVRHPMPAMVGWHPWFRRHVDDGPPVEVDAISPSAQMYTLDAEAIPSGALEPSPAGPWDNCFIGLDRDPTLRWPGLGALHLHTTCDHWVLYDQPEHAVCVEPQSAAPDVFNRGPARIAPGQELAKRFVLEWQR